MLMQLYSRTIRPLVRQFRRTTIETPWYERLLFYGAIAVVLFVSLFPFYWMTITSLIPASTLYSLPPTILPTEFTLEHYRALFSAESAPFVQYFINSLVIGIVSAALGVLFAIPGAYSFARLEYPGRGVFSRGVLVTYMFAGILMVVPIFQILVWLGLVNTRLSVVLVHFTFVIPLGLYMLGNFFRSIPKEIEEAALMDGYSRLEVIRKITIPMSLPAILAVFLYSFLLSWNEYLYASILLRDQALYTLPIGIEQLQYAVTESRNVWGQLMAASLLTTIPVLIIFLYLQRYLIEGLSFGGE